MATIVNNPNSTPPQTVQTEGPGSGFIVGLIIVLLLIVLFFAFGLPAIRNGRTTSSGTTINPSVNINPSGGSGGGTTGGSSGGTSK